MSPEVGKMMEILQCVAVGVIAVTLLAMLILVAFLFPVIVENYRARTKQCLEMVVAIPQIERDLARIAEHGQSSEHLLRELRDEPRANNLKLDSVVDRLRKG